MRRRVQSPEGDPRVAWALFLILGLPLALMGVLTILARGGIYVPPFGALWQPWPPELLKPFIGVGGFVATLAYLVYRIGRRTGFRSGTLAGIAAARNTFDRERQATEPEAPPPPPAEPAILIDVPTPDTPSTGVEPVPPPPVDATPGETQDDL